MPHNLPLSTATVLSGQQCLVFRCYGARDLTFTIGMTRLHLGLFGGALPRAAMPPHIFMTMIRLCRKRPPI